MPTYTVSPQFAHGKLMYQPTPNPVDEMSVPAAFQMAEAFPTEVKKAAVMYANYAATIDSTEKWQLASEQAGWTYLDCPQVYNIQGESDWKPFVQQLKDCGAEIVYFSGSPYPNFENVLDAAKQIDYKPKWMTEANFYDAEAAGVEHLRQRRQRLRPHGVLPVRGGRRGAGRAAVPRHPR